MKTCSRCKVEKPFTEFVTRSASKDGYAAACRQCLNTAKRAVYQGDADERERVKKRSILNKRARFERDPAYKRAFNLWGSTKKRTRLPPWVSITDFLPVCRKAIRLGSEYEIDHIVPLKHPLVCGLHVPDNVRVVRRDVNARKGDHFLV